MLMWNVREAKVFAVILYVDYILHFKGINSYTQSLLNKIYPKFILLYYL